jgi:formylglycine-generating enzyme required for sulfatase activity
VARPLTGGLGSSRSPGSPLALIRTRNGLLKLDDHDDLWAGGEPPPWADDRGWDAFGAWVTFRAENVTQRLRWIPPGTFWMGSPEDEEGRCRDEGPRHEETVQKGFWMFDTPCTQALWKTVMVGNPSHFQGDDRPVEAVSWDECQEFIKRLNEKCQGLQLALPTETQWEYACRAGTETPRYGENLDYIAWYGKNSQRTTHPVGQKAANDWGLYDMLGNVFEWCENTWTDDYSEKSRAKASAHRVSRGGSWSGVAQSVRAACREGSGPSDRIIGHGFRCAEFKGGREPSARQAAGRRTDAERASGAGVLHLDAEGKEGLVFEALTPQRLCTDVETTLSSWASAIGRDKYGLWAEFTIEGNVAKSAANRSPWKKKNAPPKALLQPVRQRLRWIPPGRFLMGSSKDERGRYHWEQLPHEVAIDGGFWMFETPCTQALWEAVMGENPSHFKGPERPVETVSWEQCQVFVKSLNSRLADLQFSLPSEAQWEYACRAGTTTPCYHDNLDEIAWYGENSKGKTHPVGDKKANSWGLRDMLGNVWEWCEDDWASGEDAKWTSSDRRVIRGGSWRLEARHDRAAFRDSGEPSYRSGALGFRCAEFRRGREFSPQNGG